MKLTRKQLRKLIAEALNPFGKKKSPSVNIGSRKKSPSVNIGRSPSISLSRNVEPDESPELQAAIAAFRRLESAGYISDAGTEGAISDLRNFENGEHTAGLFDRLAYARFYPTIDEVVISV